MTDGRNRYLERQAAQGDENALDLLDRAYQRAGELSPARGDAYQRLTILLLQASLWRDVTTAAMKRCRGDLG